MIFVLKKARRVNEGVSEPLMSMVAECGSAVALKQKFDTLKMVWK